jgi:hypothetical protein
MAMKPVAVQGDASAEAGSTLYGAAKAGAWTAGPVSETSYAKLTSGGVAVLHRAACTFSFVGGSDPPNGLTADVTGTSTVTLTASGTVAQGKLTHVLRDGDQQQDGYGNTVSVSASAAFRSG